MGKQIVSPIRVENYYDGPVSLPIIDVLSNLACVDEGQRTRFR